MTPARTLLHRLLEYIHEQAKDIDPRGFRLSTAKGFLRTREGITGLPGVEFDIKLAGDHAWLRVQRLEASPPPPLHENCRGLVRVSHDPDGPDPSLDEAAFLHLLARAAAAKTIDERSELENRGRTSLGKALETYTEVWRSWAAGERPRRMAIDLYADLFSLKHQLEAEETAKPQEFVWGIGVSSWQLNFEGSTVSFEYPLLTQTLEIALDEQTLALEIRPRAADTRVELDVPIACQVRGAADVERAMREHLAKHKDKPVSPFDPSTYTDILKLAAGNLDGKGSYLEIAIAVKRSPSQASISSLRTRGC